MSEPRFKIGDTNKDDIEIGTVLFPAGTLAVVSHKTVTDDDMIDHHTFEFKYKCKNQFHEDNWQ